MLAVQVTRGFKCGEAGAVQLEDGETLDLSAKETKGVLPMDEQSLQSLDNMVKLNDLNEASILHNLRMRFKKDVIYTYVSSILISVNPFKPVQILQSSFSA